MDDGEMNNLRTCHDASRPRQTSYFSAGLVPFTVRCATGDLCPLLSRPVKRVLTASRIFTPPDGEYLPQVLATKDWTKWDWDVVDDIVQDTLPHASRLVDALRTKWIKRVSGFYRFVGASGTSIER